MGVLGAFPSAPSLLRQLDYWPRALGCLPPDRLWLVLGEVGLNERQGSMPGYGGAEGTKGLHTEGEGLGVIHSLSQGSAPRGTHMQRKMGQEGGDGIHRGQKDPRRGCLQEA